MKRQLKSRRFVSVLLASLMVLTIFVPIALPVSAANRRFISELRVETGEDAVLKLEEDGWSVTMVGLNVTADPASQVYLAYKVNTGAALTNVIVSPDVGDTYTDPNGIVYKCVSHVDVDAGLGGGAGCIYATTDERMGSPLVGIDVLRGNSEEGKELYPITNDGAEIVRTPSGTPADIEKASETDVVYLAQIRDGIVRPYISEIGIITDTDKWNAVYTACERGFNYYIEGDIDSSSNTYTIIGYDRTANASEAITNITAVSASAVKALEDAQIVDGSAEKTNNVTAAAISISGAEYVRVSSKPVEAAEPYYIYMTKDKKAGNPVSMLYAESPDQAQNFFFGTWANAYFFSPGVTTAYTYSMNEDLYETLWEDQTVCSKLPVRLIDSFTATSTTATSTGPNHTDTSVEETSASEDESDTSTNLQSSAEEESSTAESSAAEPSTEESSTEESSTGEPSTAESSTEEPSTAESSVAEPSTAESSVEEPSAAESSAEESSKEESSKSAAAETVGPDKFINLTMLTPREGLPDTAPIITGLRSDPMLPFTERTQRSDRINKFQASIFGSSGLWVLIPLGVLVIIAVAYIIFKKVYEKKASEKPKKTNRPDKPDTSKKQSTAKKQSVTKKQSTTQKQSNTNKSKKSKKKR